MKVFLDSNAFVKNWFVSNANFKLLFHFLNNEMYELLLSELVVQEVNNIRQREIDEIVYNLEKNIKEANKLNINNLEYSTSDLGICPYDISKILPGKIDFISTISYKDVPHENVVKRALKLIKPFSNQEKGYRDTLIWLSFLDYLKTNDISGDVAFITNNKSDFFKSKNNPLSFNTDLSQDIESLKLKANIIPFLNIYEFIKANVDKIENAIDKYQILDEVEDFLIPETEDYINSLTNQGLSELLSTKIFSDKITAVSKIESDIFEGVEDPDVQSVSELPGSDVFISCYFEMRRVDIVVTIDIIEFKQHADAIENIKGLYNIETDKDTVNLSFICRLCIEASFEYDISVEIADNLTIHEIYSKS